MLALITTLVEIAMLRKGPDAIPRSPIFLLMAVLLWLSIDLVALQISPMGGASHFAAGLIVATFGLLIFAGLAKLYGQSSRTQQMLTALIGCDALLSVLLTIIVAALVRPDVEVLTQGVLPLLTLLLVWSIILWSVIIGGHILARTINQPRVFGVAIALSIFIVQYYLGSVFVANTSAVS